jgi:thioredoxin reductase/Fe-S-cluster-containing dehydrogenase component/pSer/pThr/pTyr-binding forkhead associated (FHA) protein
VRTGRSTGWFRRRSSGATFELLVVEGPDATSVFRLDQAELHIGRGDDRSRQADEIFLTDRFVSSRHAIVHVSYGSVELEHVRSATNATLVNGRAITRRILRPGDQITIGSSLLELRIADPRAEAERPVEASDVEPAASLPVARVDDLPAADVPTPLSPLPPPSPSAPLAAGHTAQLVVMGGIQNWVGRSFDVGPGRTTIGRSENCDITTPVASVSRRHAALAWEGGRLFLVHQSMVNPTFLNGVPVEEPQPVVYGDRISLADSMEFFVAIESTQPEARSETTLVEAEAEVQAEELREEPPAPVPPPAPRPVEPAPVVEVPPPVAPLAAPEPLAAPAEVVIVGSGPAGLAAAAQAASSGLPHTLLERGEFASTVHRYHKGKWVMDEPQRLAIQEPLPVGFRAGPREEVLAEWQAAMERTGVNLRQGPENELVKLEGEKGDFTVTLKDGSTLPATHVVLAIGTQGNLRTFGVEGDDYDWITYQLADPAEHAGKTVVVVGAGDAGIENALALVEHGCAVSLINRHAEFDRAKGRNRSLIEQAISAGSLSHYTRSSVASFEDHVVVLRTNEGQVRLPADIVIGRLGATPPRAFLEGIGIEFPSTQRGAAPELTAAYESNVPGVYVIGALAGYPLIKSCMNQGYEVIERIQGNPVVPADEPVLEQTLAVLGSSVDDALRRIQRELPIYSTLTLIQLREFMWDSEVLRLAAGEVVFERNDFSATFYAILEGSVEVTSPASEVDADGDLDPEQRREARVILRAGSFFGEGGLISGRRRSATVVVAEDAVLVAAPRMSMNRLIRSVEEVRRVIDEAFVTARLRDLIPEVDEEARAGLAACAQTREFKPGEVLFEEGDAPDGLHIIRRGTVTVSRRVDGLDSVVQYCQAGSVVGELALLAPDRVRSMTVRTSVATQTVFFPAGPLVAFMQSNEEVTRSFQRAERRYAMADSARSAERRSRDTLSFVLKEGGHEATDLLLIDEALCIRCDNCEQACATTHGGVSRLDREAGATYASSRGSHLHIPTACQHCENPKCMDDCPPDALRRDRNGEVFIMDNCIGCGNCEVNCPYGVIQMAAVDDNPGPGLLMRLLFGRVDRKASGGVDDPSVIKLAVKCDLCRNLQPMRDGSARAACVASCPTGAIVRVNPRAYVDELIDRA